MDHNDVLDESSRRRRQTLVDFLRKSCRLGNDFDDDEIHRILGILSVNSFVVHDGGSDEANTDLVRKFFFAPLHNFTLNLFIMMRLRFSLIVC